MMPISGSALGAHLLPSSSFLALEQRILFDGAAAVAADQQHHTADATATDPNHAVATTETNARSALEATKATLHAASAAAPATHNLMVVDSRVEGLEELKLGLAPNRW